MDFNEKNLKLQENVLMRENALELVASTKTAQIDKLQEKYKL